jgi:hypothetical protein
MRLPLTTFAMLALLTSLLPVPPALGYHENCDTYSQPAPPWNDPKGVDYQNSWEAQSGQAPASNVGATITITCTIRGHSIPPGELCPIGTGCVKFWASLSLYSGSPGTLTDRVCSNVFINGAPTTLRETAIANGVLCEYYCSSAYAQCGVGQRVTVAIGATLAFQWEADDTLGSERSTTFAAINRAGTSYYRTHTTCQAGNPILQLAGGQCGIL